MRLALRIGILVPILYFGAQFVAMRFYPGYDVMRQAASELGSDRSTMPVILNSGAMATGIAMLISVIGFFGAFKQIGVHPILRWVTCIALISAGIGAVWAGWFPLPDPRHNAGAISAGMFFLPLLFWASMRKHGSHALRTYLLINMLLFVVLVPVMRKPPEHIRGALQRVAAAVLYVPVGVVAFSLARRLGSGPRQER